MSEWIEFGFKVVDDNYFSFPLTKIFHITHIRDAIQVISEEQITARPVYDKSRLNKSRVHVVWLSPNEWDQGSFYGNIRFHFDWNNLINGRKVYWVESIDYNPPAPRFLITDKKVEDLGIKDHVVEYDPCREDGPLKKVGSNWYWNGRVTLEVMIEADIALDLCSRVDVVKHHPRICRLHKSGCPEFRRKISDPGAELLGFLIGTEQHIIDDQLTSNIGLPNGQRYHNDLMFPVAWLDSKLSEDVQFKKRIKSHNEARALIRAACLLIAFGKRDRAQRLIGLLESSASFDTAFEAVIQKHFSLEGVRLLFR